MAWVNYALRRMMVAAALLALCVVDAAVVRASSTSSLTAVQQTNTLKFLQDFVTSNPSLGSVWTGTDFCTWPYVSCSSYSGGTLDFEAAQGDPPFTGTLVLPKLSDDVDGSAVIFTSIRATGLSEKVTGTLPSSWGRLTALESLYLQDNALTGTLPAAWSGLTLLGTLSVRSNRIGGTLPAEWNLLENVKVMYLDNNTLSGTLPPVWGLLKTLSTLYLNDNALSGTLPSGWRLLTSLRSLYLTNNRFVGSIPETWSAMPLYNGDVSANGFCGCLPTKWRGALFVKVVADPAVAAANCSTANACPVQSGDSAASSADGEGVGDGLTVTERNTLKFLQLLRAAFGTDLQSKWSGTDYCSWSYVSCSYTAKRVTVRFSSLAPSAAVQLPELTADIDGSHVNVVSLALNSKGAGVVGSLPSSWGRLTRMEALQLYGNALTGTLPAAWSGMTALSSLQLDNNRLEGSLPSEWGALPSITTLSAASNTLSGSLPAAWGAMTRVTALSFDNNSITGKLPPAWSGMTALRTLVLSNNRLEGGLPPEWRFLGALSELSVPSNTLSGTLPAAWGLMSALYKLNISDNALSGTLPVEWASVSTLRYLYLAKNRLVGSIPAQWGGVNFYGMDLSSNSLCGCLPEKWKSRYPPPTVDPAVSVANCSTTNACEVRSADSASGTDDSDETGLLTANELSTLKFLRLVGAAVGGEVRDSWSGVWYCLWPNVKCDSAHLASVTLSSATLSKGVRLPELTEDIDGRLVDVKSFSLSGRGANVTGTLPSSWSRLTKLATLNLYGNALTGTLPAEWSGMTALYTLCLDNNRLEGSLPAQWRSLSALYELRLSSNTLSGTLPAEWSSMPSVYYLYLNNNALSGTLPAEWALMPKISYIYLKGNDFCGCVPDAWKSRYILGSGDDSLTSPKCATMNRCVSSSESADSLAGLTVEETNTLKFLRGFAAINPSLATVWTGIYYCEWAYVHCGSYSPSLDFSSSYDMPAFAGTLVLPELGDDVNGSAVIFMEIDIHGMGERVTGILPPSWSRLTRLVSLYLQDNALSGTLPASWSALTLLTTLHLEGNRVGGSLPSVWAALSKLEALYLSNNALSGTLPGEWGSMAKVSSVYLQDNQLSGSLPAVWSGMSSLSTLNLSSNRVEGSLPAEWSSLKLLEYVYLQSNQLSGSLPAVWSGMSSLSTLNLSSNVLTGTLPAEWSSMSWLRELYLAKNELGGSIPATWGKWYFFTADLSGNHLCGCKPKGWEKNSSFLSVTADPAVTAADCATANACPAGSSSSESSTTTSSTTGSVTGTTTSTTTISTTATPLTNEQINTLYFLLRFSRMDVSLAKQWTGTNYCTWNYVWCSANGSVRLDLSPLKMSAPASVTAEASVAKAVSPTRAVSLPEVGVGIDVSYVAVTELSVYGKGAQVGGMLPSSWAGLTRLETVNLQGNAISGALPDAWSQLTSLRVLNLSGNALTGGVPSSWVGLSQLTTVDLTGTGLCGCLPAEWKTKNVSADGALKGRDCASANACPAEPKKKSGPNLTPLWCVLGAVGGLLVGVAVGLGVRFYRRRQREEELRLFQASQGNEMEPFNKVADSPY